MSLYSAPDATSLLSDSTTAIYAPLNGSSPEKLRNARQDLCIMHPLPRVNEISVAIDDDPRACYFKQVLYGKYMRMALILKLLKEAGTL